MAVPRFTLLIETMRREGFELSISRPRVLFRGGPNGREEPYETVVVDADDEHSGTVVEKIALRKPRGPTCARGSAGRPASPSPPPRAA